MTLESTLKIKTLAIVSLAVLLAVSGPVFADAVSAQNATNESANASERQRVEEVHHVPLTVPWESGRFRPLERQLAAALVTELNLTNRLLSEGRSREATAMLRQSYAADFDRYVVAARRTTNGTDDRYVQRFERAGTTQRLFLDAVTDYRTTRNEYRLATLSNDPARARRLARESNEIQRRVNTTSTDLTDSLRDLDGVTDRNVTNTVETVRNITANVASQQRRIRSGEFEPTRVTATARNETGSFRSPILIDGRILTANGSAVDNRTVDLLVGHRRLQTNTDGAGNFSVSYRPVTLPTGPQDVRLAYQPRNSSIYLGSADNISVTIRQVEPTISIESASTTVRYGDPVTVNGQVGTSQTPAESVPLRVTVDGTEIGLTTTDRNGVFEARGPLPATISEGTHTLSVVIDMRNRSLAPAVATQQIEVRQSPTTLSMRAQENRSQNRIAVDGALQTSGGDPVGDRRIRIFVDGQRQTVLYTGSDGRFRGNVTYANVPADGMVSVTATFSEDATNLGSSRTTTVVNVASEESESLRDQIATLFTSIYSIDNRTIRLGFVFVTTVLVVIGLTLFVRSSEVDSSHEDFASAGPIFDDATETLPDEKTSLATPASLFAEAQRLHDAETSDPATVVTWLYAAIRRLASSEINSDYSLTTWEFYERYQENASDEAAIALLADATRAFERVFFADETIESESVQDLLNRTSERLSDGPDGGD